MRIAKPKVAVDKAAKTTVTVTTTTAVETSSVVVARVPDRSVADRYVNRYVNKVRDFDLFDAALRSGYNILLDGPTGPGKTMSLRAFAAERQMRFYAIPSNVAVEPSQLFGKPWNRNGVWEWVDGGVTDIVRNGGLLVVNEVNFLPDRIATVLFSLLDDRREITLMDHYAETVRAHRPPNPHTGVACWCDLPAKECEARWVLVAADMNTGYEGTRPLNKALRNRFAMQVDWGYDRDVEKQLVRSKSLLDLAYSIRTRADAGEFQTPVSTNMLMEFEAIVGTLGLSFAIVNFVAHFAVDERVSIDSVMKAAEGNLAKDIPLMTGAAPAVGIAKVPDPPSAPDPFDFIDWEVK